MRLSLVLAALAVSVHAAPPLVDQVYPSGSTLPVNVLRISIQFQGTQSESLLSRLALVGEDGREEKNVLLPQELWSTDRKTLTLLFDPGRLKSGVGRHERDGLPLAGRSAITLTLDGEPLKTWHVLQGRCSLIDPRSWHIMAPRNGSLDVLQIYFGGPVDKQSQHLVAIVDSTDQRVVGQEQLTSTEAEWMFKPVIPWSQGEYRIVLHPDFENPCGDRVGDSFEHPLSPQSTPTPLIRFTIPQT